MSWNSQQYERELREASEYPLPRAVRQAGEAWLKQATEIGQRQIKLKLQLAADRLNNSQAENFNACQIAEAISAALDSGKLSPSDALAQAAQLRQIAANARAELPRVQEQLAAITALEPLAVFDDFCRTFPALADRLGPPPPLPA